MAQNAKNVIAASPVVTGGVAVAPFGTPLPTNANSALDPAFVRLGYVSEDGLEPAGDAASLSDIVAWGGDVVISLTESKSIERYEYVLIEVLNADVNKFVFTEQNVTITPPTATEGTQIAIVDNATDPDDAVIVFDMMYSNKRYRIVCPNAKTIVNERNPYTHTDAAGYGMQTTCLPDENGNRQYIYIANDDLVVAP